MSVDALTPLDLAPRRATWAIAWTVTSRIAQMAATLLVASFLSFVFLQMAPGDPVTMLLGERAADPQAVARLQARFHLDQPVVVQYWHWLSGVFTGDLGTSYVFGQDVRSMIAARLPTTLTLVSYSSVLVIAFGFFAGLIAARSKQYVDTGISIILSIALATPSYVIAIGLITVFSLYLDWFPVFGSGEGFWGRLHHLTLPAITLALSSSAALARVTRASLIEESRRDHVATAVVRGFRPGEVLRRHVIRNALLPITTIGGIIVAALVAGTVIVEKAYGLDGVGSLLVLAITRKDYPVVQGVGVLIIAGFLIMNALVDMLYTAIDPRTRTMEAR